MKPRPKAEDKSQRGSGKLQGKVAIITGGDSGIGRAVAVAFAKEGADVSVVYLEEHRDAKETEQLVEQHGRKCLLIDGDVGDEKFCAKVVDQTLSEFGRIDILVNNAAEQHPQDSIEKISAKQLERTFRTNVFAYFFLIKAAMKHLKKGAVIVNTTSVTAYKGSPKLLDYSSSKGAEIAIYPFVIPGAGGQGNSRQRRRTRSDLDAADSIRLPERRSGYLWVRCAVRPRGATRGNRTELRLPASRFFI